MRQLKIMKSITPRDSQAIEGYLKQIGKERLITVDEEVLLTRQIKQGDSAALEKLVRANLRFVVSVAKQYQNNALSLNDLISEGNLGLVKAAYKFDETRGFKFISYAVWWIRQSITSALDSNSKLVRLPLNQLSMHRRISKASESFVQKEGREPTAEEIAPLADVSVEDAKTLLGKSLFHKSLDAGNPEDYEEGYSLIDIIADRNSILPDHNLQHTSLKKDMDVLLEGLTEREQNVLKLFFGIDVHHPQTLEDIAEDLGLTRERTRQIKDKAIMRLRSKSKLKVLREYR